MPTKTNQLDLAQRIAEHVARTSEPRPCSSSLSDGDDDPKQEPIGKVPVHLRHLHNLLEDLANDADAVEREYHERKALMSAVRDLFFTSLKTHVPDPEGASCIMIRNDWSVIANMGDGSDSDLASMIAATIITGGRRR